MRLGIEWYFAIDVLEFDPTVLPKYTNEGSSEFFNCFACFNNLYFVKNRISHDDDCTIAHLQGRRVHKSGKNESAYFIK